ncbi:MAG: ABC transporter permease [Bacteroidales bacterium]|jgi:ABC-2 type transport system permease protein|nr:ABC transporter permease [Bacteroidales bacterium]
MNKIKIIIKREYLTRVNKKSFLVMTFLGPILICLLMFTPIFLENIETERLNILVVDQTLNVSDNDSTYLFKNQFKSSDKIKFDYLDDIVAAQSILKEGAVDGVLEIVKTNDTPPIKGFMYYGESEISSTTQSEIKNQLSNILKNNILRFDYGMAEKEIEWINNPTVDFYTKNIFSGEESYNEIKILLGGVSGFLIYFFVFLFGAQVMKSVSEEKMNRIVEILVSSVKPVELLFGKIIAVALVSLTQIALWIVLIIGIVGVAQTTFPEVFSMQVEQSITIEQRVITVDQINSVENSPVSNIIKGLSAINYPLVIGMFVFYFIMGYLLYASLFGAIGSLLDVDTDGSQFTLPVTIPLILAIICLPILMENPTSNIAFWLSIIPFTAPVAMMVRIPFGVPIWEICLSCGLMIIFIILCIMLAAKIYRTGILMYGKKISYSEVWKWIKYRN